MKNLRAKILSTSIFFKWITDEKNKILQKELSPYLKPLFLDWLHCLYLGINSNEGERFLRSLHFNKNQLLPVNPHPLEMANIAFILGTLSHILEIDDSEFFGETHPSGILFSSLLSNFHAVATVEEFLIAAHCGYITFSGLGNHMNPDHYESGWHGTGTLGPLGASIANSVLLKKELRSPFIHSQQFSCGHHGLFGTSAKPISTGRAAMAGIISSFTSDTEKETLDDGNQVFFTVYNSKDLSLKKKILNSIPTYDLSFVKVKEFPSCHCTHSALKLINQFKNKKLNWNINDIDIKIFTSTYSKNIAGLERVRTINEAFFSIKHCASLALHYDKVTVENFQKSISEPKVGRVSKKISINIDDNLRKLESRLVIQIKGEIAFEGTFNIERGYSDYSILDIVLQKAQNIPRIESIIKMLDNPNAYDINHLRHETLSIICNQMS